MLFNAQLVLQLQQNNETELQTVSIFIPNPTHNVITLG